MNKKSENPDIQIRNKFEYRNLKPTMPKADDSKPYDLEDRTFNFAKASRAFVKKLRGTIANV
jgi:hypothetical protein